MQKARARDSAEVLTTSEETRDSAATAAKAASESLESQLVTYAVVTSIDARIEALVKSNLLADIAAKANVDPIEIRQLAIQSKNEKTDTLSFAKKLATEDRLDQSYAFARFIGETSIQADSADYRIAFHAFHLAANMKERLANGTRESLKKMEHFRNAAELALRGIDAFRTLPESDRKEILDSCFELSLDRANFLSQIAFLEKPVASKDLYRLAIKQIDSNKPTDSAPKKMAARWYRNKAFYLARLSVFLNYGEEAKALDDALELSGKSLVISDSFEDAESKLKSILVRLHVQQTRIKTQSYLKAKESLEAIIIDCRKTSGPPNDGDLLKYHLEISVFEAQAVLTLSDYRPKHADQKASAEIAIEKLDSILQDAIKNDFEYVAAQAAMTLLRARIDDGEEARKLAFRIANEYGFGHHEDKLLFAQFAIAQAIDEAKGCFPTIDQAIGWITELVREFPVAVSPRFNSRAEMALAECYWARSQINRYASLNKASEEKWGAAYLDTDNAYRIFLALAEKHTKESFPLVRAEALFNAISFRSDEWGDYSYIMGIEERTQTLEELLNAFTVDSYPVRWAVINVQLSSCYASSKTNRQDEAKKALERALTVFTESSYPNDFKRCTDLLEKLTSKESK